MTTANELRPILIRQARLIDPARQSDFVGDLLLEGGNIAAAGSVIEGHPDGCIVIDGAGLVACPGFIDLHAHLREPGLRIQGNHRHRRTGPPPAEDSPQSAVCPTPTRP